MSPVHRTPVHTAEYNVSWTFAGHHDRILTHLSFTPGGERLLVASENQDLLLIDAEYGTALKTLGLEQTSVLCGHWYSDHNVVIGCCNGSMYDVCFDPTNAKYSVTMAPILHEMTDQIRSLAFNPERHLLAVAHGTTVTLFTQHKPGHYYSAAQWKFLEEIKGPSDDRSSLIMGLFFYPTDKGTSDLFIGYAEMGWSIRSDAGTVTRVSDETPNVCRIGHAALGHDQKSIVVSTLDQSMAVYTLGSDGPQLSSFKEYKCLETSGPSVALPVVSTSDGMILGGTTHGLVPVIDSDINGDVDMYFIRQEEHHLIRVLATHGKKFVIGSSCAEGSLLKCYASKTIIRGNKNGTGPVFVTATEALLGWHPSDSRWKNALQPDSIMWRFKPGRRTYAWLLFSGVLLVLMLSVDPPGGPSFEVASKQSHDTDMLKREYERADYWIMFGVRHFVKFIHFQIKMWLLCMLHSHLLEQFCTFGTKGR
ncbi:hypothetical protein FRC12_007903 [Ceratobasidium sp. 428]|nr:hypothetical protein FRC12_007903 [Ceratobasidium sp. 428]